jgi:glyceraldehyde 3-phosphate dehydrogenase
MSPVAINGQGKFDGVAVRVPILVGSIADIVFITAKETSTEEPNETFRIENPHASFVDLSMTEVVEGDLIKVMSWHTKEWRYANQMIREALRILG